MLLAAAPAGAVPPGSPAAAAALALCARADGLAGEAKSANLAQARALAEQVLAGDRRDALAHFALFCTIGREMKDPGLGLRQLVALPRLRRELDTTLELAPNDPDALAAKGAMLLSLPRLLGGNADEAERLLRQALAADPANDDARCYLSRALSARGADSEARALQPGC
jgi:tetratricopeptide (TPR) repeat protein